MNIEIKELSIVSDNRGWLTEVLKSDVEPIEQVHFSVSKPNAVRGGHYHKKRIEWMLVTNGTGKITLADHTTKEYKELAVSGDCPTIVEIHPNVTHSIVNVGDSLMHLLILTSLKHGQPDNDTFKVI